MNYHNITKDDMLNGEGLRVVLWISGCSHRCRGCQNPQTWDYKSGIQFDESAKRKYLMSYQKTILPALHLLVAIHFIKKISKAFWTWLMKFVFHIQKKQSGCIPDTHGNKSCIQLLLMILIQKETSS